MLRAASPRSNAAISRASTNAAAGGYACHSRNTLDSGDRRFAVAAVVLHHTNGTNPLLEGWAIGNLGVAVFFSISGFLAYYVLWRDEKRLGQISYSYFLRRRILRIWPVYFVVILVAWLHAIQVADPRADRLSGLLTFTLNIDMMAGRPWPITALTPLWSIAVEEQFYILPR
jgi:peptidoglycan/LPS O-acetylase OafA/YrhL